MRGFVRDNQHLSLCGLNCLLCPMNLSGHCGGCGVDNQSCKIARCSLKHGGVAYCFQCGDYPCDLHAHTSEYDSFVTHRNQARDLERARRMGLAAYNAEQEEKRRLLDRLLASYDDGRRKTLFCLAANLLEVSEVEEALRQAESTAGFSTLDAKGRSALVAKRLRDAATRRGVELRLRRKSRP